MPDPVTVADTLESADEELSQDGGPPAKPDQDCPLKKLQVIEVLVVGDDQQPVADVPVLIASEGREKLSKTGANGIARFDGLDPGSYDVSLPGVDEEMWKLFESAPLKPPFDKSGPRSEWLAGRSENSSEAEYPVKPGECFASIAFAKGLAPQTLWEYSANAGVQKRRDPHILTEDDDVIVVPAARIRSLSLPTGQLHIIQRHSVYEALRVRLMDPAGDARSNVRYILRLETQRASAEADRAGTLDKDGVLFEMIPADTVRAEIELLDELQPELIEIAVGYIHPLVTERGIRERLHALGYYPLQPDIEHRDWYEQAVRDFQWANGMNPTGKVDEKTAREIDGQYLGLMHEPAT